MSQNDATQPESASEFEVVTIAASAGGLQALIRILSELPEHFPVPVLIVQHLDPRHETVLAEILSRRTALTVKLAEDGEVVRAGIAYIAPPDHHLLIEADGLIALTVSELVHFVRPSADLLFESAAGSYGPKAIACVLTGTGSDGAMGVSAIKARGGTVVVQDPAGAEFKGMPEAAVATGAVDFVLRLDEIAQVVISLVNVGRSE